MISRRKILSRNFPWIVQGGSRTSAWLWINLWSCIWQSVSLCPASLSLFLLCGLFAYLMSPMPVRFHKLLGCSKGLFSHFQIADWLGFWWVSLYCVIHLMVDQLSWCITDFFLLALEMILDLELQVLLSEVLLQTWLALQKKKTRTE